MITRTLRGSRGRSGRGAQALAYAAPAAAAPAAMNCLRVRPTIGIVYCPGRPDASPQQQQQGPDATAVHRRGRCHCRRGSTCSVRAAAAPSRRLLRAAERAARDPRLGPQRFVAAYGAPRVRTPSIDALAAEGIRFTRFFPEAMPTVPARRTIMTGRRVFPFRGWERAPDLGRGPGAAPIEDVSQVFTRSWLARATGLLRPATTPSSASRSRFARSGSASTTTCRSRATPAFATTRRP